MLYPKVCHGHPGRVMHHWPTVSPARLRQPWHPCDVTVPLKAIKYSLILLSFVPADSYIIIYTIWYEQREKGRIDAEKIQTRHRAPVGAIACMVDVSRLVVYSERFLAAGLRDNLSLVAVAVGVAFLGAFIGRHMMKKVTFRVVQLLVSVMLIIIAIGLGSGLI